MNTTQRKFALQRITEMTNEKLKAIHQEDRNAHALRDKCFHMTPLRLAALIESGVVRPLADSEEKVLDMKIAKISDLYDLAGVTALAAKPAEVPMESAVNVNLPGQQNWQSLTFRYHSTYVRAMKLMDKYEVVRDEIMLGSQSEALKGIQDFDALSF